LVVRVYVWVWPRFGYGVSGEFIRYYSTRGWGSLLFLCVSLSLSLASTPGSFVHCVFIVQVYVWVWPGVGQGVSGDFSSYYSTRGWGRLKTRSPFDTSSSEHTTFVTCLDLFWFPHWFVKILCSWVWFISWTRCWFILSEEVDLDSTSLVWFCWHQLGYPLSGFNKNSTLKHHSVIHEPWSMNGVHFATETYHTGFQKKDQGEDGDSRRKSYLFPKIFVTNLQFDQVISFFNVTEVSIFLLFRHHTTVN